MIKRYDSDVRVYAGDCFPEMVPSESGDYVLFDDHEAAMRANVETHAANLAAVEARALRMEQTIARVREVLREMTDDGQYVGDLAYHVATEALRAALEGT